MGIKIGRYHVYLPKMLKPKAVSLRINLWRLFYDIPTKTKIPKFGLNFIVDKNYDKNFLLLCGFENFKQFFIRVDILEKLFLSMINKAKGRKFIISPDMMNLLGCSKENFYKLMDIMNYKKTKDENTYLFYGERKINKKIVQNIKISNPFNKLLELNIKK